MEAGNAIAGNVQGQYRNTCFVFASVYASWKIW